MKQCLVVDDSRVIRQVMCRILEGLSFATEAAENAQDALVACRRNMPDVVLLDGNMPNAGGLVFLRSLRGEEKGAHPAVVLCTTENDVANISEALGAGADEYILKPFDRELIKAKLTEMGLMPEPV